MRDRLPTTRDRRLITKRPRARDYKMRARRLPENERKNSRQAPPWVFSRSIYWNRLETDPPIRDHGPKEQGESVYRDMGNVSGIRVRPRKRILYRTRIDDTDFLSFSVLIRLIAAYKYSIIRVIECCSMTLGGDVAGRETKENVRPFTRPFLEKLRYRRLRLPFLPYLSLCAHTAIHRTRFSFTTTADSCK